ncbi:MAG: hypothetical protein WDN46_08260 [Methylocella sp.]
MSLLSSILGFFTKAETTVAAAVPAVEKDVAAVPTAISTGVSDVSEVLAALTPISPDFAALEAAWRSKNLQAELAAGLPIVEGLLKAIAVIYPPAAVAEEGVAVVGAVLTVILPVLVAWASKLQPDGRGGFISQAWAADPANRINPDGTFEIGPFSH